MTIYARIGFWLLSTCVSAVIVCALSGCSGSGLLSGGSGSSSLTVRNLSTEQFIKPDVIGVAYSTLDSNTADVFLTDLPVERLADHADDLSGLNGSLIHVHLFLVPSAGDTPIGRTACNVTVRMLVLSQDGPTVTSDAAGSSAQLPRIGLYSGAGFVMPSGKPGSAWFGGSMFGSSIRLTAATPGFADPLTPAEMAGNFRAPLRPDLARSLMARLNRMAGSLASEARPARSP